MILNILDFMDKQKIKEYKALLNINLFSAEKLIFLKPLELREINSSINYLDRFV